MSSIWNRLIRLHGWFIRKMELLKKMGNVFMMKKSVKYPQIDVIWLWFQIQLLYCSLRPWTIWICFIMLLRRLNIYLQIGHSNDGNFPHSHRLWKRKLLLCVYDEPHSHRYRLEDICTILSISIEYHHSVTRNNHNHVKLVCGPH